MLCAVKSILTRGAQINAIDDDGLTPLAWAAMNGNEELCQLLLDHNAQTEIKGKNNFKPLFVATCRGYSSIMKLLLDHGARIDARDAANQTVLAVSLRRYYALDTLLVFPIFNPFLSEQQFQISRQRIWTALCVFQRYCPELPKDMRKLILCSLPELEKDMHNAGAFGIFKNTTAAQTPLVSLPIVRLLIKKGKLDPHKTALTIKAHHFECLRPLMLEAMLVAPNDELRTMLNPARLEENFGEAIEQNIKKRLELLSIDESKADSEKSSKYSLQ